MTQNTFPNFRGNDHPPQYNNPNPMPPGGMSFNTPVPNPDSVIVSRKKLKKIQRRWLWALPAFGLGLFMGLTAGPSKSEAPVNVLPTLQPSTPANVTPGQKKVAPKPKVTTFMTADGIYLVGENIAPGTYRNGNEDGCYWARLRDTKGDLDSIIANGVGPNQVITIAKTDRAIQVRGCGGWLIVKK